MCEKGTWVNQIEPDAAVRGFFRLVKSGSSHALLCDASGNVPVHLDNGIDLRPFIGKVSWISGYAMNKEQRPDVHVLAALPATHWTGNPFALIDPQSPGYPYAARLYLHVQNIRDQETSRLIEAFFAEPKLLDAFMSAPASLRHHHSFPGGLAAHTCETLDMAERISSTISDNEHALVMAACLLHDAGKAFEYDGTRKYLSPRGNLLGHETTLLEILAPVIDKIWERGHPKRLLLLHLLTAKPAPQWTGIRHPRTKLVSIVRFADRWSSNKPGIYGKIFYPLT